MSARRHAVHAAGCKAVWVLAHVAGVHGMLHLDTDLRRDVHRGVWWSTYFLTSMLLVNSCQFLLLCSLSPRRLGPSHPHSSSSSSSSSKQPPQHSALPAVVHTGPVGARSPRCRSSAVISSSGGSSSSSGGGGSESEAAPLVGDRHHHRHHHLPIHHDAAAAGPASCYCQLCGSAKDLRTHHCKLCQQCVHGFDHHCVWVGRCVGRHNHGTFWLFLLTQTTLAAFSLHQFLTAMRRSGRQEWGAAEWAGVGATLWMLGTAGLVGGLLLFHSYLIATNQTSREVLAREHVPYLRAYPLEVAPFNAGCCLNLFNACWRPAECDRLRVTAAAAGGGGLLPMDAAGARRGGGSGGGGGGGSVWDNELYSCF